mmetsp:Transcript_893/g.3747  ORF Transcript_893/g.3747 Transcript_893/m.3747 type:complete len:411 (-) Transcript_893:322-1554(-)
MSSRAEHVFRLEPRHLRAEQSQSAASPGRRRPGVSGSGEHDPDAAGGRGRVHVLRIGARGEPDLRRAGRGGQELRRARLPAAGAPRKRACCFFVADKKTTRRRRVPVRARTGTPTRLVRVRVHERGLARLTCLAHVSEIERGERVGVEEVHGRVQAPAARRRGGGEGVRAVGVGRRVFSWTRSRSFRRVVGRDRSRAFGRRRVEQSRRQNPARGDAGHTQRGGGIRRPPALFAAVLVRKRLGPLLLRARDSRRRFRILPRRDTLRSCLPAHLEGDREAAARRGSARAPQRRAARVPVRGQRAELGVQRAEKHNQLLVRRRDGKRLGIGNRCGPRGDQSVVAEHPPLDQHALFCRVGLEKNLERHASRRRLGGRTSDFAAPRPQRLRVRRELLRLQVEPSVLPVLPGFSGR